MVVFCEFQGVSSFRPMQKKDLDKAIQRYGNHIQSRKNRMTNFKNGFEPTIYAYYINASYIVLSPRPSPTDLDRIGQKVAERVCPEDDAPVGIHKLPAVGGDGHILLHELRVEGNLVKKTKQGHAKEPVANKSIYIIIYLYKNFLPANQGSSLQPGFQKIFAYGTNLLGC